MVRSSTVNLVNSKSLKEIQGQILVMLHKIKFGNYIDPMENIQSNLKYFAI